MADLPQNLLRTEVASPDGGRRAEGNDFGAGRETLIGARRSASNATRSAADASRARAGSIDRVADAELRADLALAGGVSSLAKGVRDVGDALYERKKQAEISDLTAKAADSQAKWAAQLDETLRTADPADTQVVPRFLKDFDAYGKEIEKGATTRAGKEYARQSMSRLRGHFFETAMRGQAELASVKKVQDFIAHQSQSSTALMVDPEGLPLAFERLDAFLASSKSLDAKKRLELETTGRADLSRAAVRGIISRDFGEARERLKAGEFSQFLDADATNKLLKEVDAEERDQRIEADRQREEARKQREEEQRATGNDFVLKIDEGKLTPKMVRASSLDWREKEHFLDKIERKSKGDDGAPKTNWSFAKTVMDKIEAGEIKSEKQLWPFVYSEDASRRIDRPTFEHFVSILNRSGRDDRKALNTRVRELKATAKRLIIGATLFDKADGPSAENYYKFGSELDETVDKYVEEGKDPAPLFDPESKEFFGKKIGGYLASRDEQRKALMLKNRGQSEPFGGPQGVEPRKVGESAADYLRRTKGGGK